MTIDFPSYGQIFDALNSMESDYLEFYRDRTGVGQRILELGSGTGRLLIPLAAQAEHAYGVDYDASTLDIARTKAAENGVKDRVTLLTSNIMTCTLPSAIDVIFFSCDTITMIGKATDRLALFRHLCRQMSTGCKLLINVSHPQRVIDSLPKRIVRQGRTRMGHVSIHEERHLDVANMLQLCTKTITFVSDSGQKIQRVEERALGIVSLEEIRLFSELLPLRLESIFGGYDGSRVTNDSEKLIVELFKK